METEKKTTILELEADKYHIILGISDIARIPSLDTINTMVDGKSISIKIPDIQ